MSTDDYTLTPGIGPDGNQAFSFTTGSGDLPMPYRPFPVDCLPDEAAEFVRRGSMTVDADPAMVALPLLSCVASCIGSAVRLKVNSTWIVPAIVWTCLVGKSGSAKSPAAGLAIDVMKELADRFKADHAEECKRIGKSAGKKSDTVKDKRDGKSDSNKVNLPQEKRIITTNGTMAGLANLLQDNPKGLLYHADELAGWMKDQGRYSANKADDADAWNELYDGKTLWHDRKVAKSLHVRFPNVCVTGGIQPSRLFKVFSADHLDSGLVARILFAMPPHRVRLLRDDDVPEFVRDRVRNRMLDLLDLDAGYANSVWKPNLIQLDSPARRRFRDFHDKHQQQVAAADGALNAALSKLTAVALRLALPLELFTDPDSQAVSDDTMERAITMTEWFIHEAERIYSIPTISPENKLAGLILETLVASGESSVREMQRRRNALRPFSVEVIESHLFRMKRAGMVNCRDDVETGGRPVQVWRAVAPDDAVTLEL